MRTLCLPSWNVKAAITPAPFRMLSQTEQHSSSAHRRDEFIDRQGFDDWFAFYRARLQQEQVDDATRQAQMNAANPAMVVAQLAGALGY